MDQQQRDGKVHDVGDEQSAFRITKKKYGLMKSKSNFLCRKFNIIHKNYAEGGLDLLKMLKKM
jgi:hypothetical protein